MNGHTINDATKDELDQMNPGQKIQLRVRRGSQALKIKFNLGARQEAEYRIEEIPGATAEQLEIRQRWLAGTKTGQ